MKGERTVAGIRCGEVLAELSDFVDGALDERRTRELSAHVDDCDVCERFGSEFAAAITALRGLGDAEPVREDIAERLRQALAES